MFSPSTPTKKCINELHKLEYNNFLGSGWVEWSTYLELYNIHHNVTGIIGDYPITRSHMFRIKDVNINNKLT